MNTATSALLLALGFIELGIGAFLIAYAMARGAAKAAVAGGAVLIVGLVQVGVQVLQ